LGEIKNEVIASKNVLMQYNDAQHTHTHAKTLTSYPTS